jgi:hypothetical protein
LQGREPVTGPVHHLLRAEEQALALGRKLLDECLGGAS